MSGLDAPQSEKVVQSVAVPQSEQEADGLVVQPNRVRRRRSLILVLAGGCVTIMMIVTLLLNQLGVFAFPWAQTLVIPTTAEGVLEDAQNGAPIRNARITVSAQHFQATTTSDI